MRTHPIRAILSAPQLRRGGFRVFGAFPSIGALTRAVQQTRLFGALRAGRCPGEPGKFGDVAVPIFPEILNRRKPLSLREDGVVLPEPSCPIGGSRNGDLCSPINSSRPSLPLAPARRSMKFPVCHGALMPSARSQMPMQRPSARPYRPAGRPSRATPQPKAVLGAPRASRRASRPREKMFGLGRPRALDRNAKARIMHLARCLFGVDQLTFGVRPPCQASDLVNGVGASGGGGGRMELFGEHSFSVRDQVPPKGAHDFRQSSARPQQEA